MMDATLWLTLALAPLLALSFFFSLSETSLTGISRAALHRATEAGDRRADLLQGLIAAKERAIAAILVGNNLVNILISTLMANALIAIFGEVGVAYATVSTTIVIVVFFEVLPKTLALARADGIALAIAAPLRLIVLVLTPPTRAVEAVVGAILRPFGIRGDEAAPRARDWGHAEIRGTVDYLHAEGGVAGQDRDMLGGVLDLKDLRVSDVMVHRADMVALDIGLPAAELARAVAAAGHGHVPLYRGERDNVVGVVTPERVLQALLDADGDASGLDIAALMSPPWFVLRSEPARAQLAAFRERGARMAVVLDEHGALEGLVTVEDIVEEIVGEIDDMPADDMAGIEPLETGGYALDGALPVRLVNRALGWSLPEAEAGTVAGLVIAAAQTIPPAGHELEAHGFRFKVLRRRRQRLTRIAAVPVGTS